MNLNRAIDLYIGDLARRGRQKSTRTSYQRLLFDLADLMPRDCDTRELQLEDYEKFLDRWVDQSPSTLASSVSLAKGFSTFLHERGYADTDVAHPLKRPRRQRPEDLDVVTVSKQDVEKMLAACENYQELICVATAVYLGARRKALAQVRWGDVDLTRGTIRFLEKGGKVSVKPLPFEYLNMLIVIEREGFWPDPSVYLIPNRRPASVRRVERSDKVIWNTVRLVARRAGVRSHVHALRAAFAVQFDEQYPDQLIALKELMGHARLETTETYLRRKDVEQAKELNRGLKWGASVFESQAAETSDLQGKGAYGIRTRVAAEPASKPEQPA